MAKKDQWPGWWFGPHGEQEIFNSPEEVPEGWVSDLSELAQAREAAKQEEDPPIPGLSPSLAAEQRNDAAVKEKIAALVEGNSQADLAARLGELNKTLEDKIEFLPGWPKLRLATLIVQHSED